MDVRRKTKAQLIAELDEARQREARWKTIADHTSDWGYWLMPDGRFAWMSPSVERITGYPASDFLADPDLLLRIVHPDDRDLVVAHLRHGPDRSSSDMVAHLDFRIFTRTGDVHWISHSCVPIYDDCGNLQGCRASNIDVTVHQAAADELRRLKDFHESIVQNGSEGIAVLDERGHFTFVNRAAAALLGYHDDELIHQHWTTIVPPDQRAIVIAADQRRSRGEADRYELDLVCKDGRRITTLVSGSPQVDAITGRFAGTLAVFTDITVRKRVEEVLRESEQRYHQLIELLPDAVAVHCEGILVYVNQAGAALIGARSPDELVGQPLLQFVHPDYRALTMERARRTIADQVSMPWTEEKFLRLDGSVFDVEVATIPFVHQGQPAVQVIVRDITERKRAAAALGQRAGRLALLNRIARAIGATLHLDDLLEIIYREVTQVLLAEAFFVALYDRTTQELDFRIRVDREVREPGERRPLRDGLTDSVVINKQPLIIRDFEQEKDRLPPVKVWGIMQPAQSLLAVPMLLGETVVGVISVQAYQSHAFGDAELELLSTIADTVAVAVENARLYDAVQHYADDLELRVAHRTQELTAAYERLQDLDRVKDEFVSRISHELRTPLANIQLYLGLLERGKPEKHGEYLLTLRRETDRLNKLIEDLLDLSHLDMGKTTFNIIPLDLNRLVIDLLPDRVAQAAERGLTLSYHLASDLPPALADPTLTAQVMINLLSNALNYTPRGGSIDCYTTQQPADDCLWITFTVKDNGPGIGLDEQQLIFGRFYRGRAARNYKVPGTGLGLAICKEIVDKLDGRITLQSQVGQGAEFTIWLPPA